MAILIGVILAIATTLSSARIQTINVDFQQTVTAQRLLMLMVQVAVAGLDCNRSEVVQDCLERLVGEWEPNSCLLCLFYLSTSSTFSNVNCYQNNLDPAV